MRPYSSIVVVFVVAAAATLPTRRSGPRRRVRLDLTLSAPTSPATRLSATEAQALLGLVGLGAAAPTLGRPSQWVPSTSGPAAGAALAAAAWAEDTLAGLADTGTTLPDGTELFVGRITFAAEGPAFSLPPDAGDPGPPDFAALAAEYGDVLAGPPPGLPPDRGPAFLTRCRAPAR